MFYKCTHVCAAAYIHESEEKKKSEKTLRWRESINDKKKFLNCTDTICVQSNKHVCQNIIFPPSADLYV